MSVLGGAIGAIVALLCTAAILQPATSNLSPLTRVGALILLMGWALLLGALTGSAIGRRSRIAGGRVGLFAAFAGAVCGGLVGGGTFLLLTGAYLRDYAVWPSSTIDLIVSIAALPVLGALGLCLGALTGFGVGGISGLVLAAVVPKRAQNIGT